MINAYLFNFLVILIILIILNDLFIEFILFLWMPALICCEAILST